MPSQADLAAAFARMRQNNSDAGSGIRNGAIDLNNVYGNHLGDAPSVPPISFGGKGSSSDSEPLWMKALTGLFSPGKAVTNQFANWTDGKMDWKDIPLAESLVQGGKAQWNDWTDGKASWGDIPGFGFLHGVGSQGQGFGKTLTNLGAKPGGYLEKIGGLEGDILFDPLNLVTFGAGSAIKAGAKASQIAAKGLAKEAGLTGKIAAQNVPGAISDAVKARYAGSTYNAVNPIVTNASKDLQKAYDISTNELRKYTKQMGKKYGKAFDESHLSPEDLVQFNKLNDAVDIADSARFSNNAPINLPPRSTNTSAINPDLVARLAGKKASEAQKIINDAGKAARNKAQNAAWSIDIPGMDKTWQFGSKPAALQIKDTKIGATGTAAVTDALAKAGIAPDSDLAKKILKDTYGVDHSADLTSQGLKHLQDSMDNFASKFTANDGKAKNFLNGHNIEEQMKTIFKPNINKTVEYNPASVEQLLKSLDPRIADRIAPMLRGMNKAELTPEILGAQRSMLGSTEGAPDAIRMLGEFLGKLPGSVKGSTAKSIEDAMGQAATKVGDLENVAKVKYDPFTTSKALTRNVTDKPFDLNTGDEFLKTLDNFVQDAGGKSRVGASLAKVNPFNARAFQSADTLASQSANSVRDATTKINGQTRQANEQIAEVEKAMQGLSDTEKRAVIYETQKHYPKGFDKTSIDTAKVQTASSKVKAIMDQIGQRDLAAGGIKELRNNYFPHVLKKDGNVDQLMQDPDIAKILGMSKSNNFGKAREGFQTIAQLDEVVAGLEKAAAADPAKAEALLAKADELRNLFDTNVTSALGTRAYKSVRSSAYAGLFKQLEKDGLMARPSTTRSQTKVHADSNPESFHKLNADEAKVLGVEAGTMIHKDTFEGMQRVQDLFTVKGANKLLENINGVVSIWKSLVTSYIPAHYFNNFVGNIANNMLAGVKPESYQAASKLLKSMKSGNVSTEDMKIVQAAFDKGVFGSGFSSDFVKSQFKSDKKPFADKVMNNAWTNFLRKYGENGDDLARMSLFIHGVNQTGSTDKAAEMVRKYLFNYSERSHGDTIARSVAPFWMWTKNNLPLQIQSFMQQPRYYATYKKIKDAFNADVEGGQNKPYTTDNYLHLPGTDIGLSLNSLPMNNLNMFGTGALDTLRSTLGMAAPPFKAPAELGLNRQFFNNAPIYYEDNKAAGIGKYLLNQTGALGKAAGIADGQGNPLLELLGGIIGKPVEYK